ncbi:MAG: histidine phosphatase family protein [Aquisalinus sp.]|nr:histidine phosphatase family protein [Aquisalinus sp.]
MTEKTGRRRLYLMRHGHVDYFAEDVTDFRMVPLTKTGQGQAESAGTAMADIRFDAIYHSGLPRTRQTAEIVTSYNTTSAHTPHETVTGMEELRGGVYVTDSREELAARLAFSFEAAHETDAEFLPGGERFSEAYQRITTSFEDLVLNASWRTALLVAHEGVNRILLSYVSKAGLKGLGTFEQDLACINILDVDVVPDENDNPRIQRIILKAINVTTYDHVKQDLPKTSLEHLFDIDFQGLRLPPEM